MSVNQAARAGSGYDYTQLLAGIRPWIEGADLALCALEVPIVPPGEKPSNYPAFGSPPQIADSLKALGWDGCALATNHSMDRGFPGVVSTVDNFDRVGLGRHGTARTGEESTRIQYYKVRSGGRDVVVAHVQVVEGVDWAPGLGPARGDEGALGAGVGHGHAIALVACHDWSDVGHADLLQGLSNSLREGSLTQRPGVEGRDIEPAGGRQHVEAAADGHSRLVGEHVTTRFGNRLDAQGQVNDDLTGVNDPARHACLPRREGAERIASRASQSGPRSRPERSST